MRRRLTYASRALADLDTVRGWLTQPGSGPRARRKLISIWIAIERLRDYPCLYTFGDHPGVREAPTDGGYRALYRVYPDTGHNETAGDVVVLRVFGPRQSRARL